MPSIHATVSGVWKMSGIVWGVPVVFGASKNILEQTPLGSEYPYWVSESMKFEVTGVSIEDVCWVSGGCLENVWMVTGWYISKLSYCQESNYVRTRAKRLMCMYHDILPSLYLPLSSIFWRRCGWGGGVYLVSVSCLEDVWGMSWVFRVSGA